MKIKSLTTKSFLTDDSGDSYIDLSVSSFKENNDSGMLGIYVVTKDTEMRIDLISLKYYGNTNYIDAILMANNIANPFSIQEGDVLAIPDMSNIDDVYSKSSVKQDNEIKKQFTDVKRLSKKDKNRINRLKKKLKNKANVKSEFLPPNMLTENEKPYTKKDDKIIF